MTIMIRSLILIFPFLFLSVSLTGKPAQAQTIESSDPFPNYAAIQPNIAFWEKVFTQYSSLEGVIHDKIHLDIIYEVIPLVENSHRGARKINRKRIKAARKKYKNILLALASGKAPVSAEEKRIQALMGRNPSSKFLKKAAKNIRCQVGTKDKFLAGLIRSGAYIKQMRAIFRSYQLPMDLCYLPHVESSFNLKAYSKFGAAGVWQFTRSTGRRFLKIDYAVDERRDPLLATHAAAKFLSENFNKLGSWPLALTAYNHGANGMMRAKKTIGNYERIFKSYRSRSFRFASRNFYPEFLAAREIAKNYTAYFGAQNLDKPVRAKEIILPGYVALDQLTAFLNSSPKTIERLNPALRPSVFRGQKYIPKGFRLRVHPKHETILAQAIQSKNTKLFLPQQQPSRYHLVRRGETAGEIAGLHGIRLSDLILANNLNSRATIYPNQNLQIPNRRQRAQLSKKKMPNPPKEKTILIAKASGQVETTHIPQKSVENQASSRAIESKETQQTEPAIREKTEPTKTEKKKNSENTIDEKLLVLNDQNRENEYNEITALQLAAQTNQPPALNLVQNAPAENEIQETAPPEEIPVNPNVVIGDLTVLKVSSKGNSKIGVIRVTVEETLGHYADWLKVRTQSIRRLNNLKFGSAIHIDQLIKIPLHKVSKAEFEEKRYENQKETEEDFFSSYKVEKIDQYRVKPGDNIWTLCYETFEIPIWLVKKYNADLDFSTLRPSQKLKIPVVEKIG